MTTGIGIILALVAMISWGFGDFLIQKSTRKVGDFETLFIISIFGAIVLTPFVWHSIPNLLSFGWDFALIILIVSSIVLFLAALLEFESLRRGELSVVEPSWSIEIPAAAFLAFFIIKERISIVQILLIIILIICLALVGLRNKKLSKSIFLEKGIILALVAGTVMGAANFLMGWGGRISDPLMVNFFTDVFLVIASGIFLLQKGKVKKTFSDLKHSYKLLLPMSLFDKIAWVAFVFSMSLAPIAIATAFSESYIIITVLLGIFINREKLQTHQKVGLIGAVLSAIILALITSNI